METREVCESVPRGGKERKVAKRRRKGGWEAKANSRAVRAAVELHLHDSYSLRAISRARARAFTVRQLQVTCIVISKSSLEPVFLHIARGH